MKYPCTILRGKNSNARCVSIAVARDEGIVHDTGAKMIHIGKNTKSQIISKSISCNGGNSTYRGLVKITNSASNSCSNVDCETLIIDKKSKSDTYPREIIKNNSSSIKHEAKITNFDKEKIFSLNCKGINNKVAKDLIISGFIEPFSKELPIEYAVELNRLLKEN
jgi:Fe-S cluster assembly protein SufB